MEKVYLKINAEDIQGNCLNTRIEYTLLYMGLSHSIINNGYRDIHVNNIYIKFKPRSHTLIQAFLYKEKHSDMGMNTVFLA